MRLTLVAEAPITKAVSRSHGFASRDAAVLEVLSNDHDVAVVYLEQAPEAFAPRLYETAERADVHEIPITPMPRSRSGRLLQTVRLAFAPWYLEDWERAMLRTVTASKPDVVVALAPVCRYAFRTLPSRFPTVTFVEEDQSHYPERQRTTLWGRSLAASESRVEVRPLRRSKCTVVISNQEASWARNTFHPSPIRVVPHTVDARYWGTTPSRLPDLGPAAVLVAGRMSELRNAEGLRAVVRALPGRTTRLRPRVLVASSSGLHPILDDVADDIDYLGDVEDLRPYYRAAAATLVPSLTVSGTKTTILQGWATSCPVVATSAAAASVGASDGRALLAADDPLELAQRTGELVNDPQLQRRLSAAGDRLLRDEFSLDAVRRALREVLAVAAGD